jgi:hypothetical protein
MLSAGKSDIYMITPLVFTEAGPDLIIKPAWLIPHRQIAYSGISNLAGIDFSLLFTLLAEFNPLGQR